MSVKKSKEFKVNKRVSFKNKRVSVVGKNEQNCIQCGEPVRDGSFALRFNNSTDNTHMPKCLWVHIGCIDPLFESIKRVYKEQEMDIVLEAL